MPPQALTIEQVLSVLEETPQRLGVLADGMSEARLRRSPAPGEWSASEILAHLRACADVWSGAIETIVLTDHPTVRAVNPRTWIERTDYRRLPFEASMRSFAEQRVNLLAVLRPLPADEWSRSALVLGGGAPREISVHRYGSRMARHERAHWRQLERTVRVHSQR